MDSDDEEESKRYSIISKKLYRLYCIYSKRVL